MHTYVHDSGVTIHHNSDCSGEATIVIPAGLVHGPVVVERSDGTTVVRVPAAAIAGFSWDAATKTIIGLLEQLDPPA